MSKLFISLHIFSLCVVIRVGNLSAAEEPLQTVKIIKSSEKQGQKQNTRAEQIVLVSVGTLMKIDPTSGRITSLKVNGQEKLSKENNCFLMEVTNPVTKAAAWQNQSSADSITVSIHEHPLGKEVVFVYSNLGDNDDFKGEVRYWVHDDEPGVIFTSLDIENDGTFILESVSFPCIYAKAGHDYELFMPGGDGYVATFSGPVNNLRRYPGGASMQFMSVYNTETDGFTLQARDTTAREKYLIANRRDESYEMWFSYKLPFTGGNSFNSGPCAFTASGNNWLSAADAYRKWARKQWWAAEKSGRDALPSWLMDGLMMMHSHARPLPSGSDRVGRDQWGDMLSEWKDITGAGSAAVMFIGFEKGGAYCTPYITPFYPSNEKHSALLADISAKGHYNFAMLSTLNYQIEREPCHNNVDPYFNNRELFNAEKDERCVVNRHGNIVTMGKPDNGWVGFRAHLCPGVEANQILLIDIAKAMANAGVDVVEHDQMNGGTSPPCYATNHGHAPGYGFWLRESIGRLIRDMRASGQAINPNTASGLEDPGEVYVPCLDSYLSRTALFGFWPAQGKGSYIVGAFQFVYNPLIRATGPFDDWSTSYNETMLLRLARVFIAGVSPWTVEGMSSFDGKNGERINQPWPENQNPIFMEMFTNVVRTQAKAAKQFMMHGERLVSEPMKITDKDWFIETDGLQHPRVLNSAWQAPDGRVAFVFINSMLEPASFAYDFAIEGKRPPATSKVKVYENGLLKKVTTLPDLADVKVPAKGTLVFEFEPVFASIKRTGPGGGNTVSFEVSFSEKVKNVTADDFEISVEPVIGSNLVANGDFESGKLTNWNLTKDVSVVSTDSHGGKYSALGTDFGKGINYRNTSGSTTYAIAVEPGRNYRLRMWVKTDSTGRVSFYHYYDDKGSCFYSRESASGMILNKRYGDIKQWSLLENDFTAAGRHFSMCFESETKVYLDDVELFEHLSMPVGVSVSDITTRDKKVYKVTVDCGRGAGIIDLNLKRHNDIVTTNESGGGFIFERN
jgi:hypothetical protein